MREGDILKAAIDKSSYEINDVLRITKISRGQLYNLYKLETIKPAYKEKLKRLNLEIDWAAAGNDSDKLEIFYLKEKVKDLQKIIETQDLVIKKLSR